MCLWDRVLSASYPFMSGNYIEMKLLGYFDESLTARWLRLDFLMRQMKIQKSYLVWVFAEWCTRLTWSENRCIPDYESFEWRLKGSKSLIVNRFRCYGFHRIFTRMGLRCNSIEYSVMQPEEIIGMLSFNLFRGRGVQRMIQLHVFPMWYIN